MAYKEKICPKCGDKHTKRGEFCSRSCGNQKKHTWESKSKIANTQMIRMNSDDPVAEEQRHALANQKHALAVANGSLDPVPPPKVKQYSQNQFVQDGDLWTEV